MGSFPTANSNYFFDLDGGSELGGTTFLLKTGSLDPSQMKTATLGSSFTSQFSVQYEDSQSQLRELLFLPMITEEKAVFYFPQIGDGIAGSGAFKTNLVFVNTGEENDVEIQFFNSDGTPMNIALSNLGTASEFSLSLSPNQSISVETPGQGPLKVGYAKVETSPGIGGTAVFSYSENGVIYFEAGVPASARSRDFTLYMDASGQSRNTGLAVVNTGDTDTNPIFKLYDSEFRHIGSCVRT